MRSVLIWEGPGVYEPILREGKPVEWWINRNDLPDIGVQVDSPSNAARFTYLMTPWYYFYRETYSDR